MQTEAAAYERIILKLSGEALQAPGARENISPQVVLAIAERIKEVRDLGVQIGVVIGGGNIWRGTSAAHRGMDRTTADYMAIRHLELGRVVIFVAGTGNPYFSTDTTAALRASEIGAEVLLKATKVDGVYDSDPNKNPNAKRYEQVSYTEALSKRLQVMDSTAFSLCMDNKIPIVIFNMNEPENIRNVVLGRKIGTVVCD